MPAKTAQAGLIHERLHFYAAAFLCVAGLAATCLEMNRHAVLVNEVRAGRGKH